MKKIAALFLICCLCLTGMTGCVGKEDNGSGTIAPAAATVPDDEILLSEKWGNYFSECGSETAQWAKSISPQNMPVSLATYWANVGGVEEKHYYSRDMIISAFNSLAILDLGSKTNEVADDNSISIGFIMSDGTERYFSFNDGNAEIRRDGETEYYRVQMNKGLEMIFDAAKTRSDTAEYSIDIIDGADWVIDCPDHSAAGSVVRISTLDVTDGEIKVTINGTELGRDHFTSSANFEFTMPDEDVELSLSLSQDGYGGA